MFVSKKKLKVLVDENMALKKQNRNLKATNERLSDNNLDLWYENKILTAKLQKKEGQKFGEYFYAKEGEKSDNQSK